MDSLELLVRDTLAERAADAPAFRGMRPRRRPPTAALASAAAVVVVVAVSVTLVLVRSATPPATSTALWRAISYHGITIKVPSSLAVRYGTCGPAPNWVIVSDELARSCPRMRLDIPGTAVTLSPDYSQDATPSQVMQIDGLPARRGYRSAGHDTVGTIVIPQLQVVVTAVAPSRTRVDAILNTLHVTPVDALGCPDRVPAPQPGATPPAATPVVVCRYESRSLAPFWLIGSHRLTPAAGAAAAQLLTALDQGPTGDIRDTQPSATFVLRFVYLDGSTRSIELRLTADAAHYWIRDDQRSAVVPAQLVAQAAGAVL